MGMSNPHGHEDLPKESTRPSSSRNGHEVWDSISSWGILLIAIRVTGNMIWMTRLFTLSLTVDEKCPLTYFWQNLPWHWLCIKARMRRCLTILTRNPSLVKAISIWSQTSRIVKCHHSREFRIAREIQLLVRVVKNNCEYVWKHIHVMVMWIGLGNVKGEDSRIHKPFAQITMENFDGLFELSNHRVPQDLQGSSDNTH